MGDKSKIVFEHLKSYIGYYFTIIAILGSLWTIFVFYDKWKDEKVVMRNDINELKQDRKDDEIMDSLLLDGFYKQQTRLNEIDTKTTAQGKEIKGVKTSVVRYISKDEALPREDFIRFILELNGDSSILQMHPYLLPKNKTKKTK